MAEDPQRPPFRDITPEDINVAKDEEVEVSGDKAVLLDSQAHSSATDVDAQQRAIVSQLRQVFLKMEKIGMENTSLQTAAADLWVRASTCAMQIVSPMLLSLRPTITLACSTEFHPSKDPYAIHCELHLQSFTVLIKH